MRQLFRTHPFASSGFVMAAAVTLFFVIRIVWSAVYWANHHDETVKPWMTVGYIGKSWHLDPMEIDTLAGLPGPKGHGPWTIKEIAASRGVAVSLVIKEVNDVIATLQAKKAASHD